MKLTDVILPGNKIDIRMLHEANQDENGLGVAKTYQSAVSDIFSDTELEISMPTNSGRMVLFQMNRECDVVFFTRGGMYRCTATVLDRYRKDQLYLLKLALTSELEKFQRREFFRIPCMAGVNFYRIDDAIAQLPTTEELFAAIQQPEYLDAGLTGTMQDISGGGIRFVSEQLLKKDEKILLCLRLTNAYRDERFYLVGQVIESAKHPQQPELFMHRIKFLFRDLHDREKIVRFVFEEERRIRRKEVG